MASPNLHTWAENTLRDTAHEGCTRVRLRMLDHNNITVQPAVSVSYPVKEADAHKLRELAETVPAGGYAKLAYMGGDGTALKTYSKRSTALVRMDDGASRLSIDVQEGLSHDALPPVPGDVASAQNIAAARLDAMPLLITERMSSQLIRFMETRESQAIQREERLLATIEKSHEMVRSMANTRTTAHADMWERYAETREENAALAADSAAREDAEPASGGSFTPETVKELRGLAKDVMSLGQLKDGARTGKLLTQVVASLAEGRGVSQLSAAVKALPDDKRVALLGHLAPLLSM